MSSKGAVLMKTEIHCNIVKHRSSMTAGSLMGTFLRKPFYVSITNLTARPVNLPEFLIITSASYALPFAIHARDDEQSMVKNESHVSTQCNSKSTDPTINAVHY